jgi:hypothetical protein
MAFSQRTVAILALFAILFIACVAASERQPLFADSMQMTAGGRALPQRFQEMVQRRRLAQAGSYGVRPAAYGTYGVYGR